MEVWVAEWTNRHGRSFRKIFDNRTDANRCARTWIECGFKVYVWDLMARK